MNERSKLLDVIRHYLSFDVEMDYMAVFASFLSSEDSSVRCACERLGRDLSNRILVDYPTVHRA